LDDETYATSRWIAEPFRLFDCSRENDGAAALLLTTTDAAASLRARPVHVIAAVGSKPMNWGETLDNDDAYSSSGFKSLAKRLWATTGLSPDDIDVVQVYENFTGAAVSSLIDHGFCTIENAGEVLTLDNLTAPSGRLPINTSGGNVGEGFVHGIGLALEAVRQIRGESFNQVPNARLSMLLGGPGDVLVSSAIFGSKELS
jgi:acetyl-CoA acetyltransferase